MSVEARYLEPELPEELDSDYRRTFERMRGHFRVRGISPEEASDMAQEAAIRAYMHVRRRGVTGETLFPLMNQIARNMLIDRHRRGGPQIVPLEDAEPFGDQAQDPTETVVALEARRAVREAVAALPERHRDAILMALQGLTPAQVAERMGIGRNAADALLHRARRSLKDRLRVVSETALGLATLAYLKVRGGRRATEAALANPSLLGAVQGSIGAAAAAIVIAFNVGAPAQIAAAAPVAGRPGSHAASVVLARHGATTTTALSGVSAPSAGGGAAGLATIDRSGSGGFGGDGSTGVHVHNYYNGSAGQGSTAGVDYQRYEDPGAGDDLQPLYDALNPLACSPQLGECLPHGGPKP